MSAEINLRVTGQSSQGGRKYMEDAFVVAFQHTEDKKDLEYAFFGIFDGHGGKEAAQYAKNNLLDNIVCLKHFWQDDDQSILSAIRDGFIATHMAMWKEVVNWPKTASGLPSTAGTTASIAFIRKGKLYTGHVGDSRIVIGLKVQGNDDWQAECLTTDHKPESPLEKQRIIDSGGLVMNKSGVERVVWKRPKPGHEGPILRSTDFEKIPFLAVARSLGDLWSYDFFQREFVVSPEPDLGVLRLDLNKDKCIILASDGLWNIMGPHEAVHLVQDVENENGEFISKFGVSENVHLTLCNPSRILVDCSLERWNQLRTRADNVSVLTILLDEIKSSEVSEPALQQQLVAKINYPRTLPVWDVGLKRRSASTEPLEETNQDMTEAEISFLQAVLQRPTYSSVNPFSGEDITDNSSLLDNCCKCTENSENSSEDANVTKICDCKLLHDRLQTNSPLQSCSNFLPEYCVLVPKPLKTDAEGIENSPCQLPCWSKNATGRTSLSKLATWSRIVSQRRMSDPFPKENPANAETYSLSDDENSNPGKGRIGYTEIYSLSDDENSNPGKERIGYTEVYSLSDDENSNPGKECVGNTEIYPLSDDENSNPGKGRVGMSLEEMGSERDPCDEEDMVTSPSFAAQGGSTPMSLEEASIERDCCNEETNCGKDSLVKQNFQNLCLDQLSSIKQAIKRKYPGTEISKSYVGSNCRTDKCEVESSQKRKLDVSSNLLNKMNGVGAKG